MGSTANRPPVANPRKKRRQDSVRTLAGKNNVETKIEDEIKYNHPVRRIQPRI